MSYKVYINEQPVNIPHLLYTIRNFTETAEAINKLCDIIENQQERISALYDILYKIAPELEVIETMSDTEEEEQAYIDKYMNHGSYLDE